MTKDELLKEHPVYIQWQSEWRFFIRSYFGGKRYRDGNYLLQHPFESDDTYKRRKQTAYFYNYCGPIVDIFVSLLFKRQPTRDFSGIKGATFDLFQKNADLEGNTYAQFMREVNRWASVYGRVSVIVDKPSTAVATQGQAEELGIYPYMSVVTPENIINWSFVRLENGAIALNQVHIVEAWDDGKPTRIRVWTRNEWMVFDVDKKAKGNAQVTATEFGFHGLGVVPIVNFYNKNAISQMLGVSDIEDIADINKNIYYLCSDAQEIIENTAFPMLAIPYDKGGQGEVVHTGPKNILQFDPAEPNSKPFWLEAPHNSLDDIETRISVNTKEIYKIANLNGVKSSDSIQPMSGIALDIENQQRDASLQEKADNMEQSEAKVLTLWGMWENQKFTGNIEYSNDFSIRDLDKEITNTLDIINRAKIQSFNTIKNLQKKVVKQSLSKVDEETMDAMFDEIDKIKIPMEVINGNGTGSTSSD